MTEDHDLGLSSTTCRSWYARGLGPARLLGILGGVGVAALAGCALGDDGSSSASGTSAAAQPAGRRPRGGPPDGGMGAESDVEVADGEIPEETAGPYPGDGSNGPNVLTESGIVRSDITTSFGSASGVAEGVPLTLRFRVYDLSGDEVDAAGRRRALRCGTATARAATRCTTATRSTRTTCAACRRPTTDGWLSFTTIFPGCYAGPLAARALRGLRVGRHAPPARRTSCAPPSSRSRRTSATRSTPTEGYERVGHQPRRRQPRHRRHLQRRLLAAAGQGHRLGRGGLRRHAQRPDLREAAGTCGSMGGCRPPRRPATRRPPTGRSRSGAGRAGRAAVRALRARAVLPRPVRLLRLQHLHRRGARRRRVAGDVRRVRDRRGPAGPAGAGRRRPAGVDGLRRRRYADPAAARRPGGGPRRRRRRVRARRRTPR